MRVIFKYIFIVIFFYTYSQTENVLKVVIDPFHGGRDLGNLVKKTGIYEKDVNLLIAKKVIYFLQNKKNISIIEVRASDIFVDLNDKIYNATSMNANLYIGINSLSSDNIELKGSSVFILNLSDDLLSRNFAIEENKSVKRSKNYKKLYPEYNEINPDSIFEKTKFDAKYLELSNSLSKEVNKEFKLNNIEINGIYKGPFVLLHRVFMPSAIINIGYLSNPEDLELITSDKGQDKLAQSIANAIINFKNNLDGNKVNLNKILGKENDSNEKSNDEKLLAENIEIEKKELEKTEKEKADVQKLLATIKEKEEEERERKVKENIEAVKLLANKKENEKKERERIENEKIEAKKLLAIKKENEKKERERIENEMIEAKKLLSLKKEVEKKELERIENEKIESEKLLAIKKENEKKELERIENEKKETEKLLALKKENEKKDSEKNEKENIQDSKQLALKNEKDKKIDEINNDDFANKNLELSKLLLEIEKAKSELSKIKSEISTAKKELSEILDNIESAKKDIKDQLIKNENAKSYLIKLNSEIVAKIKELDKNNKNSISLSSNENIIETEDFQYNNADVSDVNKSVYRIQVFACVICQKIPTKYIKQSPYKIILKLREEGLNKFFIYETTNKEEIYAELKKIRELGYSDAFPVLYIGTTKLKFE